MGSGSGPVTRAVASYVTDPQFESSQIVFTINSFEVVFKRQKRGSWAVVVAQILEQLLPT